MPHFMFRWQFNDISAKALITRPHDRTSNAKALIEGCGGKLHSYYFCMGEYDGIGIVEFADTVHAAGCSMKAASTGAFARFETTPLLTAKEGEAAMKHAHDSKSDYKPPHA